jgi:hypothetical protein
MAAQLMGRPLGGWFQSRAGKVGPAHIKLDVVRKDLLTKWEKDNVAIYKKAHRLE